jgi:hypothetical protein
VVGGLTVLWGPPGCFKTFTAISMSVSVASGLPWFGCNVRQGPVLYILGEGGLGLFLRRASEAARLISAPLDGLPLWVVGQAVDLAKPDTLSHWWDEWDTISPVLVVVDTLSRCMSGDENQQKDMQAFIASCDALRARWEASVLILHHANRTGTVRGSSVLPGAVDVSIGIDRVGPHLEMSLKADKLRDQDTESFPHTSLWPEVVVVRDRQGALLLDEYGDRVTTLVMRDHPAESASVRKTLEVFAQLIAARPRGWVGYKEWCEAACNGGAMSASTFKRSLQTIMADVRMHGIVSPERGQYEYTCEAKNPMEPAQFAVHGRTWGEGDTDVEDKNRARKSFVAVGEL